MTATVTVRFGPEGQATVQSYVRLTASTHIQCSTYDDAAPILSIHDGAGGHHHHQPRPWRGHRRRRDVRPPARRRRDPVRGRAGHKIAARNRPPAPGPGPRRAGSVMALQIKAGRLELVPPAAPGLSPATGKEEVSILCAA